MSEMARSSEQAGEVLRARGLRSTPQRRAILAAFNGGAAEHLSAEEVFARAAQSMPDLSRGTVYATLAEFVETGLLGSFGTPEPVRYETNTEHHAHFRCRLCQRIFDIDVDVPDPLPIRQPGFRVQRTEVRAEGTCAECGGYEKGLRAGARQIARSVPAPDSGRSPRSAAIQIDSPLGPLLLAGTADGIIRVAFEGQADVPGLRELAAGRRRTGAASGHLRQAAEQIRLYFAGEVPTPVCEIDWALVESPDVLQATLELPHGSHRSYSDLDLARPPREVGRVFGSNPIALLAPCHRVSRGIETPTIYVGGPDRRRWLERHELEQAG